MPVAGGCGREQGLEKTITALAKRLRDAAGNGKPCKPLRDDLPALDLNAAYAVQETNTARWLKDGLADFDSRLYCMVLEINGRPVQIGSSAAILGHPARPPADAARIAAETGDTQEASYIVMAGGATAAEALRPDSYVRLTIETLGQVGFKVTA